MPKKRRRGRPRNLKAQRRPDGNPVRPERERQAENLAVVREARRRVFGLTAQQSREREAGSAIGRLCLAGYITSTQLEAAHQYEAVVRAYEVAILASRPKSGSQIEKARSFDGADGTDERYIERCNAARGAYGDSRRVLLDAAPLAQMAVNAWVIDGTEMHRHVGDLRLGLNALARLYRVDEWMKAS